MVRPDAAGQGAGHALPLVIVAAAIVALLVVTAWQREYTLNRSAIGFDGLAAWLSKAGVEARTFNGGDRLTHARAGLRVYPLFNPDDGKGGAAASPGAPRRSADRAVKAAVVRTKLAALPTLLVLPKWDGDVIDRGLLHPKLLIPAGAVARLVATVAPEAGTLLPRAEGFASLDADGHEVRLYGRQLIRAGGCAPLIGSAQAMLLGRCTSGTVAYWLLADPDLIDNHGLTQGANARVAAEVLPQLAAGGPIVVDLTTSSIWDEAPKEERRRAWSDLLRFLQPPFTAAWVAVFLLVGLVLWRAWIRLGPIEAAPDDRLRVAREVSIDARARLLRLSGHDATLVRIYAADRVQSLAEALFGRRRAVAGDAFDAVSRLLAQRAPGLAARFREAFRPDVAAAANEAELLRRLDDLVTVSERIRNEFGRTAKPFAAHPG